MIRLHISGDGPPDEHELAAALEAIAKDIQQGAYAGETVVPSSGWNTVLGKPIIFANGREARYVDWSLTWDTAP